MPERAPPTEAVPPRRLDKLSTGLMLAAALCTIGGLGILASTWWRAAITDPHEVLRIASQQYVNGQIIVAGDLAATIEFPEDAQRLAGRQGPASSPAAVPMADRAATPQAEDQRRAWIRLRDFLVGAGKVARSRTKTDPREQRQWLLAAIPYLEAAGKAGFPPGRQSEGNRILGEAMFALGLYDDATKMLRLAIQHEPTLIRTLAPLLAESELYASETGPETALQTIESYLRDPTLTPRQRQTAQQLRIRSLIAMKQWQLADDAIAEFQQLARAIDRDHSTATVGRGRLEDEFKLLRAIHRIQQAVDRRERGGGRERSRTKPTAELASALQDLEDLEREAPASMASEARLWSARALQALGRQEEALALYTTVRQQRPLDPQAIIGGLEEIELLARQRRGEEALQTTRYLMRELRDRQGFQAAEVSFDEFQRRLLDALQDLRRQSAFEYAIDAARTLSPVFAPSEALMQEAIGYQQWAAETNTGNTHLSDNAARGAARLARSRYRAAGDAYAAAAELLFDTEEYLPTQWLAIEAYQQGRHFSRSIALLKPYLRYEERRRQPRGLVAYGRALLAEGDTDEAIRALTTCINEFSRDPLRYDARLLAALAYSENDDLGTARQLLTDNLQDGDLTPQSPAWRDSLFTLAELLYQRGYRNYLEAEQAKPPERLVMLRDNQPTLEAAVRYLDQAVQRYKWIPRAENAAYMSARAHILASHWPRLESQSPAILEAARRALQTRADAQLQVALDGFVQLRVHLLSDEDEQGLAEREQRMLRNCYLAEADVLREMGRLPEAAAAYQAVEMRYLNEPTALEAIVGRAGCLRELGRVTEADLLVRQAMVVLGRIPPEWDGQFAELTRHDRAGWEELLGWMTDRLTDGA